MFRRMFYRWLICVFKEEVYYVSHHGRIYDVKNRTVFNPDKNEYNSWGSISYYYYYRDLIKISKEQYDSLLVNKFCECPVGSGNKLKYGDAFNVRVEWNNYNSNENLKFVQRDEYLYVSLNSEYFYLGHINDFKKSACLDCCSCGGVYKYMINKFDEAIKHFSDISNVNNLCQ